ncbi:MAG TPA: IS3 family transposase [Bryobacteraceae bacterium]|nr:IS3 family transposase [Bryobacteraceae bacterium]
MTQPQGEIGIEGLCRLAGVARAGYYRYWERKEPRAAEGELRDRIQRICLAHRSYRYRRVRAELRKQGFRVNHKKIRRLMREDNLLGIRRRKWITTTDSRHQLAVFPNLAPFLEPDGADQLWVADLTYIRLRSEFVYLAVVLDAWSRRVVGWALERELTTSLPKKALLQAIAERRPEAGLVHHSDRGVQYASLEYVTVLQNHQIIGSMSRTGYPYDNARCESFMKTLKQEEIHCRRYGTMEELRQHLEQFIEQYYNQQRLHSALAYRSPAEFEQAAVA